MAIGGGGGAAAAAPADLLDRLGQLTTDDGVLAVVSRGRNGLKTGTRRYHTVLRRHNHSIGHAGGDLTLHGRLTLQRLNSRRRRGLKEEAYKMIDNFDNSKITIC